MIARLLIVYETSSIPRKAGNAGNHGNNSKFHKSGKTLYQTKRYTNEYLGKIWLQKTVRMKLSVHSGFSNVFYDKKRKPGNAGNQLKAF